MSLFLCDLLRLQTLKQNNSRLENRTQLVTMTHAHMGPKVFINCAGFIKIDTSSLGDRLVFCISVLCCYISFPLQH
jgi:transcription elongation factor SPT6